MICASKVASSAVVGSSAISRAGLGQQRHGDGDALAHAAGELDADTGSRRRSGSGMPHPAQHLDGAGALGRLAAAAPVLDVHHLPPDGQHGIERRHRVLEDHGDAVAAQPAHAPPGRASGDRVPAKRDAPPRSIRALAGKRREDRLDQARFAAAAFPDDADDLARRHLEGDVAQRVQRPALGAIGDDRDARSRSAGAPITGVPAALGIEGVAQRLAQEGEAERRDDDAASRRR